MIMPLALFIIRLKYVLANSIAYDVIMIAHLNYLMFNVMSFCTSVGFFLQSFKTPFMVSAKKDTSFLLDHVKLKISVTVALICCGIFAATSCVFAAAVFVASTFPHLQKECFGAGDLVSCMTLVDGLTMFNLNSPTLLMVVYHLASCTIIAKAFEKYHNEDIRSITTNLEECEAYHIEG